MSYHVKKKKLAGGRIYWKLQRSVWAGNKARHEHVPVADLLQYGLRPDMTVEDAIARVRQLNAEDRLNRDAGHRKAGALAHQAKQAKLKSAHLPARFVQEFVANYLKAEFEIGPLGPAKYKKALSAWEYVKRLVVAIDIPQNQWHKHRRRFYNEFHKNLTSPSYTGKVLRVLNMWGTFIADKTGGSFIPVPPARGYDREMIADAYIESDKRKKTSEPITPELLEKARGALSEPQYRWLYLSVWLGLRPLEVDALHTSRITREQDVPVLWVYQTKLRGIKKEDRFKPIPLVYPEQRACLDLLKQEIKKPLVKTVQKHVLAGANLYGGRKGFTDLMLSKGQALEDISIWLGHATIDRTWHSYKRRQRVSFKKPA